MEKKLTILIFLLATYIGYAQCSPDTTAPSISCPGDIVALCPHDSLLDQIAPTTSDNCGAIVLQTYTLTGATTAVSSSSGINDASYENFLFGTTTVSYYVEDASGNSASCSFTVTITDNSAPLLICPTDYTTTNDPGECSAIVWDFGFMSAWDNCSGITVTLGSGSLPPGSAFPVGTTQNTFIFTDAAGNSSSCTFDITVTDAEDPVLTCPTELVVNTDPGLCTATVTVPLATATDNCSVASIVNDHTSGGADASGTYPLGTTTVTYTATDASGRTTNCTVDITVINSQSPTITLNGADTITLEACDTYTELGAVATDNCLGDITGQIVIDDSAIDTGTAGTYAIVYEIVYGSVTVAQTTRTVIVTDSSPPTLSLVGPNPLTIGDCSTYTELGALAVDCDPNIQANIVVDNSAVDTSTLGTYTVTYNVTDSGGNSATQITRTVNVTDVSPPLITLLGDDPLTIEQCSVYSDPGVTAIDPCFNADFSGAVIIDASNVDTSTVGTYQVTYNVSDNVSPIANEAIEVIRTVNVVDTTMPTISCPGDITVSTDAGVCNAVVTYTITTSDNCNNEIVTQTDSSGLTSGDVFPIGTTEQSYTVTDSNGNTASCTFNIIVTDNEAPIASCQDITLQLDPNTGSATLIPSDIDNGSTDNCSVNLSLSQTTFDCNDIGLNTVTLTVTDDTGNSSQCTANVTITDAADNATISITASATTICINESVTFTASPTDGGSSPSYQWQVNGIDESGETNASFTSSSLNDGDIVTVTMISSLSICAQEITSNAITMSVSSFDIADAGNDHTNSICSDTTVTLGANTITANGATGTWSVTSGQTTGFAFSDTSDPTSTFTGDVGETYVLTWSIDNPGTCGDSSDSITVTFIGCDALDFDGLDDNVTFRDAYNLGNAFTIEVWVKPEATNNNIQTIISKRDASNPIDGYDLRLVNNIISFNWNNGHSLSSPYAVQINRWYHIAVTFQNGLFTLYIDGIEINTINDSAPITNSRDCIIGGMDQTGNPPNKPLNYFNGGMDELRIWDVALTAVQIRKMMNQEINKENDDVLGSFIPLSIPSLSWTNLMGYYQMNQVNDISGGNLLSNAQSAIDGRLRNITTLQNETAPLPYISNSDGDWSVSTTWIYGSSYTLPNGLGIDGSTYLEWNIVDSNHNISSGDKNITLLGLDVSNNTLSIENSDPTDGQSLRVTDYLKIDGTIDLVGESQLLQDTGSILEPSGIGNIERDQQGTNNLYNYNYWGAPVSSNGTTFTVDNILKDGTDPNNPLNLNWTNAYDANPSTSPITLSSRWIYTFENSPQDSYSDWVYKQQDGVNNIGLGFTMKGSGTTNPTQNYVFDGIPNNGTISATVTATATENYQVLVGNPYPSAIDAQEFIKDNIPGVNGNPGSSGSITGTLYFWEHYTSNDSHILNEYEGSYSLYNLSGAVGSTIPPEISGLGTSTKTPGDFIPVAQGFFVTSADVGDQISNQVTFKNSQRVFIKETDSNSIFFAPNEGENPSFDQETESEISTSNTELIKRIRLNFKTPENAIRPLLLSFIPNNGATDGFDYGYDAENTESFPNDLNWKIEDKHYLIQGVGEFDVNKQYPLSMFLSETGNIEISLDSTENFDEIPGVFIYDQLLGSYHELSQINYSNSLEAGNYTDRFYLTFKSNEDTLDLNEIIVNSIAINYLNTSNEIYVKAPLTVSVKQLYLINILGQTVNSWNLMNLPNTNEFRIPVGHIADGTYVLRVLSDKGSINKKVIIKH